MSGGGGIPTLPVDCGPRTLHQVGKRAKWQYVPRQIKTGSCNNKVDASFNVFLQAGPPSIDDAAAAPGLLLRRGGGGGPLPDGHSGGAAAATAAAAAHAAAAAAVLPAGVAGLPPCLRAAAAAAAATVHPAAAMTKALWELEKDSKVMPKVPKK